MTLVSGVEKEAAEISIVLDVIVIAERRDDTVRIRILELERRVEIFVVVGQVADVLDGRLDVVAGIDLIPAIDANGVAPPLIRQATVNHNRTSGARNGVRLATGRQLR